MEQTEALTENMEARVVTEGYTPLLDKGITLLAGLDRFIKWISVAGMAALVIMILLTFADVLFRYVFNRPINASNEITELLMVIVVYSAVAYAQVTKSHITMDILSSRLSERYRLLLSVFSYVLSLALLLYIAHRSTQYALYNATGLTTKVLEIPIKPFALLVPLGLIFFFLAMFKDLLVDIRASTAHGWTGVMITLIVSFLIVALVSYLVAYRPFHLTSVTWGILGIVVLLCLFATTIPITLIIGGVSFLFMCFIRGAGPSSIILGKCWWINVASYSWSPLMFFLFMGYMCFFSDLGSDIFDTASKWVGHLRGGLAMGSVGACAAFGAVVGDNLSGSIAMTTIGLPSMRKAGYDDNLAIGTLACSGTLGALIPPSIVFILYAVLSEQSIGDLFIAGIIPGILCAFCLIGMIWLRLRLNPSLAPPLPRAGWKERFTSLKTGGPIAALFCLVIFGIYGGIFTATEGGGIGAFGALFISFIMGRLTKERFYNALTESVRFIAMIFVGLAGAALLSTFMALSKLPFFLANWVSAMSIPPMMVLVLIVFVLLVLGCFVPAIPMVLICVPIFLPIAKSLGWDLIWFGVVMALVFTTSNVTPPFGINLFVIKQVANTNMTLMYKSSIPFILALFVCIAIIAVFPPLSTWLPNLF